MTRISVWAPRARDVAVVCGGARHAMQPAARGYWTCDLGELAAGADYAFSLDGGPPRPDPRSPWQPDGVHGASRRVDHGAFPEFASFGWHPDEVPDPQASATFDRSRLVWEERDREPHAQVLAWYGGLIALRRRTRELQAGPPGGVAIAFDEVRRWLRMDRGRFSVACTLGAEGAEIELPAGAAELVLASSDQARIAGGAIHLPGHAAAVLRVSGELAGVRPGELR